MRQENLSPPSLQPLPVLPLVHISGNRGYVWDANTVLSLRTNYHVLGALVGTLPRLPLQNTYFSLPLLLLNEELTLLLEKGLIKVADSPAAHRQPSSEAVAKFESQRASELADYEEAKRLAAELKDKSMRSAHRAKAKKPRAQDSEESFDFPTSYDGFDSQEGPVNASVGEPSRSVSEKGRATVQLVADGRQGSSVSADRNVTKSLVPSLSVVTPASIAETDTPTPVTALASMMEQLALRSAVEQPPFSPLADSVGINVNQRPVVPPILEHPEAPETAKINAQVSVASPVKDRPLPRIPISIPCSSSQLPWYNDASEHLRLDHSQATASGLWRYPSTEQETLQYKVYCALWAKGYYITSGSKFGGDYLLYPGDILRYHSHYVASVVPMEKLHSPLDAVMFGRLGTAVKKSHAVCSWDVVKDEFVCYCIQWTGWN